MLYDFVHIKVFQSFSYYQCIVKKVTLRNGGTLTIKAAKFLKQLHYWSTWTLMELACAQLNQIYIYIYICSKLCGCRCMILSLLCCQENMMHIVYCEGLSINCLFDVIGGQKSRVAFAKITFKKPHIILLDEPSNHLVSLFCFQSLF